MRRDVFQIGMLLVSPARACPLLAVHGMAWPSRLEAGQVQASFLTSERRLALGKPAEFIAVQGDWPR